MDCVISTVDGSNAYCAANGSEASVAISNNGQNTYTSAEICFGNAGPSNFLQARVLLAVRTNAYWNAEQRASFYRDPYQIFAPRSIWVPVSASSSTNPTLSLPTFVPGSLTSSGFRPRVTATWA